MAYLLDANVFMSAHNLHYGMDFCPAFWQWIIASHRAGKLFSIEKVSDEIAALDDNLSKWASELDPGFFLAPTEQTLPAMGEVIQWVRQHVHPDGKHYTPDPQTSFAQKADFYLLAQALSGHHTIVTHEVPANSPSKVKIPNVCLGLKVKYLTTFDMLRSERARFVLSTSPGAIPDPWPDTFQEPGADDAEP